MKKLFLIAWGVLSFFLPILMQAQEVIISENFDKFTAGSINSPAEDDVADVYTTYLPSELTQKEGWTGAAIHQAGGVCFVSNYFSGWDMEDGYLNAPVGDYSGKITIRFRAKSQKKHDSPVFIYASVAYRSDNLAGSNFELTDEWQTYSTTLSIDSNDKALQAMVQFSASRDVKFFIDDIEVTRQKGLLPYPTVEGYEALKTDGFTAKWQLLDGIDTYLVSVYSKKEYQEQDSIIESFDAIQLTEEHKLPSNDLGRMILSIANDQPIYEGTENARSPRRSLHLVAGDGLELKSSNKPLVHASFWAKATEGGDYGTIVVDQYVGNDWVELLEIDTKGLPDFKFITMDPYLNINASSLRIGYKGKGGIYLDDLKVYYEPDHQMADGYDDKEVKGVGRLEVTGLNPEVDYYFSVKSKKDQEVSLPSEEVFVYGLLTPEALEAFEVGTERFTARWTATPKAEGYVFYNYNRLIASEDKECVVYDETFDKISVGVSDPEQAQEGKKENGYLDAYTQYPGWMGSQLIMADGMIGTKGFSAAIVLPNIILSPTQKNRTIKVQFRAWAEKGTDLAIQVNGKRPEGLGAIHFDETGFVEKELTFDYSTPQDLYIGFLSWSGEPFLLDAVKVRVNIEKEGTIGFLNNRVNILKKQTEYPIDNLMNEKDHHYYYLVQAFRFVGKSVIFSDLSQESEVTLQENTISTDRVICTESLSIGDGTIISQEDQLVTIYNTQGKILLRRYLRIGESLSLRDFRRVSLIVHTPKKVYKVLMQ